MEEMRLNKYLAECGICSRRDADRLIQQGRVTVNGRMASCGQRISAGDQILVNGRTVQKQAQKVVLKYYKPVGVTCTERDPHAKQKVTDVIKYPVRVTYAGRLDKDSEGLLLLTNDGLLIERMMRGANGHEKEYRVKVDKPVTEDFIRKMEQGVYLKELNLTTRECQVTKEGKFTFNIVLTQGVNRQIRRMCETLGYQVQQLKRIRVMNVTIDGLEKGQYRELTKEEYTALYEQTGLNRQGE